MLAPNPGAFLPILQAQVAVLRLHCFRGCAPSRKRSSMKPAGFGVSVLCDCVMSFSSQCGEGACRRCRSPCETGVAPRDVPVPGGPGGPGRRPRWQPSGPSCTPGGRCMATPQDRRRRSLVSCGRFPPFVAWTRRALRTTACGSPMHRLRSDVHWEPCGRSATSARGSARAASGGCPPHRTVRPCSARGAAVSARPGGQGGLAADCMARSAASDTAARTCPTALRVCMWSRGVCRRWGCDERVRCASEMVPWVRDLLPVALPVRSCGRAAACSWRCGAGRASRAAVYEPTWTAAC